MKARLLAAAFAVVAVVCMGFGLYIGVHLKKPPPAVHVEAPRGIEVLCSQHLLYGLPLVVDHRYDFDGPDGASKIAVSVLVRPGFVSVHSNKFKCPLVVCSKWTRDAYRKSESVPDPARVFAPDPELPEYARGDANYGHLAADKRMDRGHMSRNKDNAAWGELNAMEGDLMSNIVPQSPTLNERAWLALEDAHHKVVASGPISEIWIMAGADFMGQKPLYTVGNGIAVPADTYKVIAWRDKGRLHMRGYEYPQSAKSTNPLDYEVPVSTIEQHTGLQFFPDLDTETANKLKMSCPKSMWGPE